MSPLNQELVQNFLTWADRGRGTTLFPAPVSPAPPFVPFRGHIVPRKTMDSGSRPTFLSKLAGKIGQSFKPSPSSALALPSAESTEPEPHWLGQDDTPISEIRALLPSDMTVAAEDVEHFLRDISLISHPLAVEIIGSPDGIAFQFAVQRGDEDILTTQLVGHFPDIIFRPVERSLERTWNEVAYGESVIIEFALEHPFMMPLASPGKCDPYLGIVAAMTGIIDYEAAVFQVIFTPLTAPWADNAIRAVTGDDGRPYFDGTADLLKVTKEKVASPFYGAIVRLAAKSPDLDRVWQHIRGMAAPLRLFSRRGGNELFPLKNDGYDDRDHDDDILRRRTRRPGMILNLDELVGLVHFPSIDVRSPELLRDTQKTRQPVLSDDDDTISLGINIHLDEETPVMLSRNQRVRHMHVIGASGSGKTTFLYNMLMQDIDVGEGVALLDPHGDLVEKILGNIPEWRIADVVLLDPSDEQFIIPFNFLQAHSDFEKTLLASDLVAIFRAQSTSWGDQMNSVFGNAIRAFLESTQGGTLADVRRFLLDAKWRETFLETVTDPDVLFYWRRGFPQLGGNKSIGPILTRLETFLSPKPIRYMVSQRENRLDFADIMDSGKIFLAKLPQGQMGKENSYLLGALLIAKLQQMAMSRQRMASSQRRPFFVYADEFQNFICPSMAEILSGARKYGMGLILAHQELRQLDRDKEVASAVLSNSFTRAVFRVGDADARILSEGFAHFEARNLQNLKIGEAICRIERADNDFNLHVPLLELFDNENPEARREEVIESSRAAYARPRGEVEAELLARLEESEKPKVKAQAKEKAVTLTLVPSNNDAEPSTPSNVQEPSDDPTPPTSGSSETQERGKGGHMHRIVQERLQQAGFERAFRAVLEMSVGEGKETVDVGLLRDDLRIACEVSVTTTIDHEMGNARKCLRAGFNFILLITADESRRAQMAKAVEGHFPPEDRTRIHCFSPDGAVEFILAQPAPVSPSTASTSSGKPKVVHGFKVKRKFVPLTAGEKAAKSQAAFDLLAQEMKKPPEA